MENKDRVYYLFALKIVGDFGATIAVPVVVFVLLGEYLDGRYHTSPWFTIAAFILAALISGKMVYTKTKQYAETYKKLGEKK